MENRGKWDNIILNCAAGPPSQLRNLKELMYKSTWNLKEGRNNMGWYFYIPWYLATWENIVVFNPSHSFPVLHQYCLSERVAWLILYVFSSRMGSLSFDDTVSLHLVLLFFFTFFSFETFFPKFMTYTWKDIVWSMFWILHFAMDFFHNYHQKNTTNLFPYENILSLI